MRAGNKTSPGSAVPRAHKSFQQLLLDFSVAASLGSSPSSLIQTFLRSTREFFGAHGAYLWRAVAADEFVGAEADGWGAEEFRGWRLKRGESAVAADAVRNGKTVFVNDLDHSRYPMAKHFQVKSLMAAPLIVYGETIGAVTYAHNGEPRFFNEDLAVKATILAAQLGSLLETQRLGRVSREQHRRAEILVQCAQVLRALPDASAVVELLCERLRAVLGARAVCVLLPENDMLAVRAVSAETPELAWEIRAQHAHSGSPATELAAKAIQAGGPLAANNASLPAEAAENPRLLAAPLRTSKTVGALLVYPPEDFSEEEKSLLGAVAAFGSVTLANAELYATAREQATELHQLLEISSELGSITDLDEFLKKFVVRAAEFLGFRRSYVALLEGEDCQVRWAADRGEAKPLNIVFPAEAAARVLSSKEVFWTDDITQVATVDQEHVAKYQVRQVLSVPLLSSEGKALGMFGVLDRLDQAGISPEDVRRARALAGPVAVVLEGARNLHLARQHRRRAEDLMSMALELNSLLRLPEFVQRFTARAAEMLGARAAALALVQGPHLDIVALHMPGVLLDKALSRRLAATLDELAHDSQERVLCDPASDLLGSGLSAALRWEDAVVARLHGSDGELIGMLCLANRGAALDSVEQNLLQALAGHASVALENARLFTRMDQGNRHWMEIFDSISDFIVVHDENHNVLRVNRPLADFIGVRPQELIGINMRALLEIAADSSSAPCPFCRTGSEPADEYVHPVLERAYLVSTSQIHSPSSEGLQTIHVLKDITDRREAERRYRELFDNIQEGLYFTSPEGRFIEVNEALVRMLGYESREELLQADIPNQVYIRAEDRERFSTIMQRAGNVRNYEETLRRKDGAPIHTLQNAFAVRDAQGRVVQFRGLLLDITELKNSQSDLQRERDFNNKILNNTQSIILVADTAGQITYANRRWYENGAYNPQEWMGQPLAELVLPARRPALLAALEATLAGHQVDNLELPITRADGRPGQFSVNLSPMRDEQGQVSSLVVVMTDITDAAMLQAKLMHTEKMAAVGQLVSGVAHEVNNPLTAILGFADLLMENPDLPDSVKSDLRVILQEAQRTKQIVQNLLSFARQMPPQRKLVQVNSILRRTLQLRSYDFASHGVEVTESLCEPLPEIVGDSHQLQQVFLNILNNAYDAVRETGRPARIEIETTAADGWVQTVFRDNGNGISHPERIFDPFFTTKEVGKGTGLGLSICYGIVREHGGEILCHNNVGREGATFVVRLPVAGERSEAAAAAGVMHS